MQYTFDNIGDIVEANTIKGYSCVVEENPLPILQGVFEDMRKEYISSRNYNTDLMIEDYGEEDGKNIMNERYPMPVNIDELPKQAKIIANKYEICGTTLRGRSPGFIVKIPNVRVRVRTYCNLGDYYCWIQKHGIDKFELKIYQAMPNEEGYLIFGGATYPHPHIAGPNPCLGSFDGVIKNAAGHFNMVGVLSNIKAYLNSYYGRSVYIRHGEFRPIKVITLPIDKLKTYPATQVTWDSYYRRACEDDPGIKPDYDDSEYNIMRDSYYENYDKIKETMELKPHEGNFYLVTHGYHNSFAAYYSHIVQKVLLTQNKFDIEYYQAYALLITHGMQMNGSPIKFGSKYAEHRKAWEEIRSLCITMTGLEYKVGYSNAPVIIRPDETLNDTASLENRAYELARLINPEDSDALYRIKNMRCNDFWKYIDKFKDTEEFLIPQENYDERKTEVMAQIDNIYPELMEYKDAFSRKVLLTLDKQKRRIQNGLKHTIPTPESNQLSFDTISQD